MVLLKFPLYFLFVLFHFIENYELCFSSSIEQAIRIYCFNSKSTGVVKLNYEVNNHDRVILDVLFKFHEPRNAKRLFKIGFILRLTINWLCVRVSRADGCHLQGI